VVPDTCLRLRTVLKALDDIVTPALPAEAAFAHEQLALIRKSVELAIAQIPHEYAFMARDAQDHLALAGALAAYLGPDSPHRPRLAATAAAVAAVAPADMPRTQLLEQRLRALKQDLEDAVDQLCTSLAPSELAAVQQLVLDHSARRIELERAWTVATGFERDPGAIPAVTDLLYGGDDTTPG